MFGIIDKLNKPINIIDGKREDRLNDWIMRLKKSPIFFIKVDINKSYY